MPRAASRASRVLPIPPGPDYRDQALEFQLASELGQFLLAAYETG
jgi:hypothetical protein